MEGLERRARTHGGPGVRGAARAVPERADGG